jgi:hypothetical protein
MQDSEEEEEEEEDQDLEEEEKDLSADSLEERKKWNLSKLVFIGFRTS